jgi:uncharacterized protein with von Willebrand factor type A (vWA) domain
MVGASGYGEPEAKAPGNFVTDFARALRASGVPVSVQEVMDSLAAVTAAGLSSRALVRSTLRCCLVKNPQHLKLFDEAFDLYFAGFSFDGLAAAREELKRRASRSLAALSRHRDSFPVAKLEGQGLLEGRGSHHDLAGEVVAALVRGDEEALRRLARQAVLAYAGIEPGRRVVGTYYLYRVMRQMREEEIEARLRAVLTEGSAAQVALLDPVEAEVHSRMELLRSTVKSEIRRILAADRGAKELLASARLTAVDELDIMHASLDELAELRRAVVPLARKLGTRLSRKRRSRSPKELNWRATIRASLGNGGVPVTLKYKRRSPLKPELFVLADLSGSVASFARFTLHLLYALDSCFAGVRSFAFIDNLEEITGFFQSCRDPGMAFAAISSRARLIRYDGHSDYGRVLRQFYSAFGEEIDKRSTVVIIGDARNNYHPAEEWVLKAIGPMARSLIWLNPEPRQYWDSGDSVMGQYRPYCTVVAECRNLRQLKEFVSLL